MNLSLKIIKESRKKQYAIMQSILSKNFSNEKIIFFYISIKRLLFE